MISYFAVETLWKHCEIRNHVQKLFHVSHQWKPRLIKKKKQKKNLSMELCVYDIKRLLYNV